VQGKKQTKRNNKGRKEGINIYSFLKDMFATVIFFLFCSFFSYFPQYLRYVVSIVNE